MAAMRVSDPSRLHLKKELTQIRKAARVLRDPGTTSSWKSPLSTSISAAAAAAVEAASNSASAWNQQQRLRDTAFARQDVNGNDVDLNTPFASCQFPTNNNNVSGKDKEKRVFLYNWKNQKSFSKNEEDDGSFSISKIIDDSLSDARNCGDSRGDTYLRETSCASEIFRCRDTNNVALGMSSVTRVAGNKKSMKRKSHLDVRTRYQRNDTDLDKKFNLRGLPKGHPSMALTSVRDDSAEQSDDTEEYSISEDLRKVYGSSPSLLKLRRKGWAHSPSKLLRSSTKEDSSYAYSTPALSSISYNRYNYRNSSTVGSWDATTTSFNDGDDEGDANLDILGQQGCGIPCYWSRRTLKHKGLCGGCYSPSLSDTLRRKGSSMLCGSQSMYHRHRRASSVSNKWQKTHRNAQGLVPLLANSGDARGGSSLGSGSDDELSTNFGELDLEALSRLDGRRWSSSCRSQDGLEIVPLNGEGEEEGTLENIRSLSDKYKPTSFVELIGQNIVVQSLMNVILRGRITPVYLLQGPHGTGKTSAARIFTAALNCHSTEETKPCGHCRECSDIFSGKSRDLLEVNGADKKKIDKVGYFFKKVTGGLPSASSRYKALVIDECHLLPSKTWQAFLKFLEEPPQRVVFIFITTDPDSLPQTVQSRCQKYLFNKIKDGDIISKLKKISSLENLDIELDALDLIALNADGSLRDAETMLDQLSLLGRKITTTLVNELVGVVSDEKLLELLELALSSNTAETVKRARELMDSGIDPIVLMSQLASLIMDIIAGTYNIIDAKYNDPFFGGRSLTEAELEKLKHALRLLSEAEKQIRVSSERSTWFTAALLQLGSVPSLNLTLSSSSRRQNSRTTVEDQSSASREAKYVPRKSTSPVSLHKTVNGNSSHQGDLPTQADGFGLSNPSHNQLMDGHISSALHDGRMIGNLYFRNSDLDDIWAKCIERCHSKMLRQLLDAHGKLLSVSEVEGVMVAYIAFGDETIKYRAERFLSSITNSIEMVLRCNVEVRIILLPVAEGLANYANVGQLLIGQKKTEATAVGSLNDFETGLNRGAQRYFNSSPLVNGSIKSTSRSRESLAEANSVINGTKPKMQVNPMQRIESIIREQRLETAWFQDMDKGIPGSLSRLKPEKNQILPHDSTYNQTQLESANSMGVSSLYWEDELNHKLEVLKMQDKRTIQKDQPSGRVDHYPMSPSLLHHTGFAGSLGRENLGYESAAGGGGCSGLFCWNTTNRTHKRGKVKGTTIRSRRSRRFSLFGECEKSKSIERSS